jgi:hypothetical protein
MAYEQKERTPGSGVLFTNAKNGRAGAPDWKGELRIERAYAAGETIKIAAWTKEHSKGVLISLKEDNFRPTQQNANPFPSRKSMDDDGDVPF